MPDESNSTLRLPIALHDEVKHAVIKRKTTMKQAIIAGLVWWLQSEDIANTPPTPPVVERSKPTISPADYSQDEKTLIRSLRIVSQRNSALAAALCAAFTAAVHQDPINANLPDEQQTSDSLDQEMSDHLDSALQVAGHTAQTDRTSTTAAHDPTTGTQQLKRKQ